MSVTAPTPINFSVAPAQRSGSFQTSTFTMLAGYTQMHFELTGMGSGPGSDYENPAIGFEATIHYIRSGESLVRDGPGFGWVGGPNLDDASDPPPFMSAGLGSVPVGSQVWVQIDLTGTFTVGIGNGTIT